MLTLFSGPMSRLLLSVTALLSSLCLSPLLSSSSPLAHCALSSLPPLPILPFFIHIHLSPLPRLIPPFFSPSLPLSIFVTTENVAGLIPLNKDQ